MTKAEIISRGAEPMPGAQGLTQAIAAFANDFKEFRCNFETKLQQQEERLTMLDRKTNLPPRARFWHKMPMWMRPIKRPLMPICAVAMTMGCGA